MLASPANVGPMLPVVISGGGPAGLFSALALARQGIDACVFERQDWPVDKACGEGLMPKGLDYFKYLGLESYLSQIAYREFRGATFISGTKKVSTDFDPGERGLGIRRTELSSMLYSACRSNPYITLLPKHRIVSVETCQMKNRVSISYLYDRKIRPFVGSYVIGCDGLRSTVAKSLGIKPRRFIWQRKGCRQHFSLTPWSHRVEVYWCQGYEIYCTPVDQQTIEVAILANDRTWKRYFNRYSILPWLASIPELVHRFHKAHPTSAVLAHGPLGFHRRPPSPSVPAFLIGDSLCFWDGITGEGLTNAAKQAIIMAEGLKNILGCLDKNEVIAVKQSTQLKINAVLLPYLLNTWMALILAQNNLFRRIFMDLMSSYPWIGKKLLDWNSHKGLPKKLADVYLKITIFLANLRYFFIPRYRSENKLVFFGRFFHQLEP